MSSNAGTNNKNKAANPVKTGNNNKLNAANNPAAAATTRVSTTNKSSVNTNKQSTNNKSAANQSLSENLSELMATNSSNLTGINTSANTPATPTTNNKSNKAPNNTSAKNKPSTTIAANNGGLFDDLFASTTAPASVSQPVIEAVANPAQTLVNTTENAIQSASDKLSEVKEAVSDRLEELTTGSDLWMNLLKIGLTILILVALFYVAKYLFTRYQDAVYAAPMLLDGMKNGKHALVISQDPANPSYIPMPNSDNRPGLELTYDFWMLIDSYEYKKGEWKHVFHKGNSSSYPNRAPGVWLHPDTNAMRVYMNTQDNILEYIDVDNLPLRKWIHVSLILHDMDLDVFINGYLKKRQKLTSIPKLNNGDFWVNMFGGFDGYLARIRYYARAISVDEIAANVRAGPGNSSCIDTGQVPPYLDDDWWLQ
jgi:hypothetical protein